MAVRFYSYPPGRGWDDVFAVWVEVLRCRVNYLSSSNHIGSVWVQGWDIHTPSGETRPTQFILSISVDLWLPPKQKPFLRKPGREDIAT